MTSKLLVAMTVAGLVGFTSHSAIAQQQKGAADKEAMAASCRAQVRKIMPNARELSQQANARRLFGTCMRNGGKL
jgi:hypothetical protein